MFTHLIPTNDDILLRVDFSEYARRHYLKYFAKKYSKRAWQCTEESIIEDLSRICVASSDLQRTQQVDELWHSGECWIFKYDFRVAGTRMSRKASGNRCIVHLDAELGRAEILMIYDKGCLPKNESESNYIEYVVRTEFAEYWRKVQE